MPHEAICQVRQTNSEGRPFFEKKVAEGVSTDWLQHCTVPTFAVRS